MDRNQCKASHYVFQIRKCEDRACCLEPVVSEDDMKWLPDPNLGESSEHYKAYEEVNGTEPSEIDRPSLKEPTKKKTLIKKTEKTCCPAVRPNTEEMESQPVTENVSKLNDLLMTLDCAQFRTQDPLSHAWNVANQG